MEEIWKLQITRLQDYEYMTDKQYDSTDFDVWKSTGEHAIELGNLVKLELHHVKGHQREAIHKERHEQGPLT